ncbi:MAG: transglycosylase SLT domain-containing protein [Bradyrhizobium sp.]|uniref:transglycosylase SLT domain-containing protein n=1 Tax=Bradyrhizobium sp. TaxID=376 RepID=UPI00238640F1|nr:transglycosylase SLT domain-containing protein [Bradyrhizobium sp.]MDE2600887.1 transglycosylase SLT domain-containing protein [Bradyrhizobium sp.]
MTVDSSSATAAAGVDSLRLRIAGAIKQAATATGTSFQYLLATAKMESDFNPKATASTSSASGLFQFIGQTWLGTVKEAGAQLGYGKYADAITKSSSGDYSVNDPAARSAVMNLRDDPVASSAMAGVLTRSNSFELTGLIGRRPTDSELYMAHFMGVGGAAKLITNAEDNPQASGARLFPNAAAANHSIFYDKSGRARSVSGVYSELTSRYASAANSSVTRTAMAALGDTPATTAVASNPPIDNAAYLASFPNAAAAPVNLASTASAPADTSFRSLFQAGERAQPVSPAIHKLWGEQSSLVASASPSAPAAGAVNAPQGLDLFSDRNGTFSG